VFNKKNWNKERVKHSENENGRKNDPRTVEGRITFTGRQHQTLKAKGGQITGGSENSNSRKAKGRASLKIREMPKESRFRARRG